jgi:hypothetical protein
MDNNLKKTVIALTRLINQADEANHYVRGNFLQHISKKLTKNENQALASSLKSMALMTKANVPTVRSPEKFTPNNTDEWIKYLNPDIISVVKIFEPSFDERGFVTKKDYQIANLYLKQLGDFAVPQAIIDKIKKSNLKGFRFDVPSDKEWSYKKVDQKILFRGIGGVSKNLMFGLLKGGTWDMSRIVSTSMRKSTAAEFARRNGSIQVIFKLLNPKNKGYVAGNLSAFEGEREVIFSGKVKITSWTLEAAGTTRLEVPGESKFFGLYKTTEKKLINSRLYFSSRDNHIKFSYYDYDNEKVIVKGPPVDQVNDLFYGEGKYKTYIPDAIDSLGYFDIDDSTIILNVNATIL